MPDIHIDPREIVGLTAEQVGAWALALAACLEHGSVPDKELATVCRTENEITLEVVRSKMQVIGSNGTAALVHTKTLIRKNKLDATMNARTGADARGRLRTEGGVGSEKKREKKEEVATSPSEEFERLIERALARMRDALNEEGLNYVMRAMDGLSFTRIGMKKEVRQRWEYWRIASTVPPEQFAIGCYIFVMDGHLARGCQWGYLWAIVTRTALSQYLEGRQDEEKKNGFKLDEPQWDAKALRHEESR